MSQTAMENEPSITNYQIAAEQLVEAIENQEEEERQVRKTQEFMELAVEKKKKEIYDLEIEKNKLDAEIMSLKLRDKAYQREQSNLRNSITVIRFQIEKIKESIENAKRNELEQLKEFEKAVDEITEKFRSAPAIYDRRSLSEKMEEEREKRKLLLQKIEEAREAYANFNREKGLRGRNNENEELLNCVLPGSELHRLIEMTKNLDIVISQMKEQTKTIAEREKELEELDATITAIESGKTDETDSLRFFSTMSRRIFKF